MSGAVSPDRQHGEWLINSVVAIVVGFVVAIIVVALSVVIDRHSAPEVKIVNQHPASPVVQVAGAVATPGVYTLPQDARLADAVAAAGGLDEEADTARLNLAAQVSDGERIVIPAARLPEQPDQPVPAGPPGESDGRININTASAIELELLPEIGPVLAARIVDDREANGSFTSVDELVRIDGISMTMVDELQPLVTIDD